MYIYIHVYNIPSHIYIYIYSLWWSSSPSALFPTFSLLRHHQPLGTLPGDAMRLGLGLGWLGDNQPETICFAIDRLQWNHIYIYIYSDIYMYNIYIYIYTYCMFPNSLYSYFITLWFSSSRFQSYIFTFQKLNFMDVMIFFATQRAGIVETFRNGLPRSSKRIDIDFPIGSII